jgi:hypothetical protein
VLVQEVFATDTQPMKTGTVSHAQTLKGWFVMVRDSKETHPGNKLWGDGWGWSWFDADNTTKTTSTDFKVNCLVCHVPAQADRVDLRQWVSTAEGIVPTYPEPLEDEETNFSKKVSGIFTRSRPP